MGAIGAGAAFLPVARTTRADELIGTLATGDVLRVEYPHVYITRAITPTPSPTVTPLPTTTPSPGTVYYVDATGGNDSNDGLTPGTPWQTVNRVNTAVFQAGDSVLFKGGETWAETLLPPIDGLLIGAYGAGWPVLDGGGIRPFCIDARNRQNITVSALKLYRPVDAGYVANTGTHTLNGVYADAALDQNVQCLNTSHLILNTCLFINAGDDGVSGHGASTIEANGCRFEGNNQGINTSSYGGSVTVTVNDSYFEGNGLNDILVDEAAVLTVNRCRFAGMSVPNHKAIDGHGTYNYCLFDLSESAQTRTQISCSYPGKTTALNNCTIYGAGNGGITVASNATIALKNCAVYQVWRAGYINAGGAITAENCSFWGVAVKNLTSSTGEIVGDPQLVDPINGLFSPLPTSPLVNAGLDLGFITDIEGNTLVGLPDVGAWEVAG